MKRQVLWIVVFAVILAFFSTSNARAGWEEERRWRYQDQDGTYKTDEWFTDEAGKTYYLDSEGLMARGWYQDPSHTWYFFDSKGVMVRGLNQIDGKTYYFEEDGRLFEGEKIVGGERFFFSKEGADCPERIADGIAAFDLSGQPLENQREYDRNHPGHYLPFLMLFIMAVAMGWVGRRTKQGYEMLFLYLAVFLSGTPLLLRYLVRGHDLTFHLNRILGLKESMRTGMFPVRINAYTFGGYGYPDPVFYPHLFFYIPAALHGLGIPFPAAVHTFLLLVNWATAMAMYVSGKHLLGSSRAGCLSGIIYTLAVYRLCNEYTRAAYGELTAMIFLPLVIWGLYELFCGDERKWILLPVAFTGIFQSHLITTVLVAFGCVLFGLANVRKFKEKKRILAFGKILALTLCLNLWTLVPLVQYLLAGMDTSSLQFKAENLCASWPLLFEIFPKAEGSSPLTFENLSSTMPLTLGLGAIAGFVAMLVQIVSDRKKVPQRVRVLFWSGVILAVCGTDLFPWRFLVRIEPVRMAASYIQYPWRFFAGTACFLALACGYGLDRIGKEKTKGTVYLSVLILSMISSQYYIDRVNDMEAVVWSEYNVTTSIGKNEYLYPGTKTENLLGQAYSSADEVRVTDLERKPLWVRCAYEKPEQEEGAFLEVPLLYFPGYRAEDQDGRELALERGEGNLIRVYPWQAKGEFRVFFREPVLWRITEVMALAGIAWLAWELRRARREETHRREETV